MKIVKKAFNRKELIALRERARYLAELPLTNPDWRRAYFVLVMAADYLDAMQARTINKE